MEKQQWCCDHVQEGCTTTTTEPLCLGPQLWEKLPWLVWAVAGCGWVFAPHSALLEEGLGSVFGSCRVLARNCKRLTVVTRPAWSRSGIDCKSASWLFALHTE